MAQDKVKCESCGGMGFRYLDSMPRIQFPCGLCQGSGERPITTEDLREAIEWGACRGVQRYNTGVDFSVDEWLKTRYGIGEGE